MRLNIGFKKWLVYGLLLIFSVVGGIVADFLYRFDYHQSQLNFYAQGHDAELMREELAIVKDLNNTVKQWKFGWFSERYLLSHDAETLYDFVYDYSIGDYNKVANSEFLNSSNDYRASHIIGSAKTRILQGKYRQEKNPEIQKKLAEELAKQMVQDISPYFKKAVEESPSFKFPDPNFDDRLNYDIASDEEAAKKVIETKKPGKKFILGIPSDGNGVPSSGKKPGEGKKLNEEKLPGAGGDAKKKG